MVFRSIESLVLVIQPVQKQEFLTDRPVLAKFQGDASTPHNSDDIKITKIVNLVIFFKNAIYRFESKKFVF